MSPSNDQDHGEFRKAIGELERRVDKVEQAVESNKLEGARLRGWIAGAFAAVGLLQVVLHFWPVK